MSKRQASGFTLIELVLILVLLGILGAVAAAKYFDMREEAQMKAAMGAVAEMQSRINQRFSQMVLQGETCQKAVDEVKTKKFLEDNTVGDYALKLNGEFISHEGTDIDVVIVESDGTEGKRLTAVGKLYVPECGAAGSGSGGSEEENPGGGGGDQGGTEEPDNPGEEPSEDWTLPYETPGIGGLIDKIETNFGEDYDFWKWLAELVKGDFSENAHNLIQGRLYTDWAGRTLITTGGVGGSILNPHMETIEVGTLVKYENGKWSSQVNRGDVYQDANGNHYVCRSGCTQPPSQPSEGQGLNPDWIWIDNQKNTPRS